MWLVVLHVAEHAEIGRAERIRRRSIGLGDLAPSVDFVIEADQYSFAHGLFAARQDHRIVEIDWTIGADCGSRTHGADHDHWLFALHCEVEEVGRLLDRVRAVRHDDTVGVVLREQLIDTFGERQPIIVGNALARDLIDLLATYVRDLLQFRHAVDERVARSSLGPPRAAHPRTAPWRDRT